MFDFRKTQQPRAIAMDHSIRRQHFGIQARPTRQRAMEGAAVPVSPIHHRRNAKATI
jgi:hypothetical protein